MNKIVSFQEMLKILKEDPEIKVILHHNLIKGIRPKHLDHLIMFLGISYDTIDITDILLEGKWEIVKQIKKDDEYND